MYDVLYNGMLFYDMKLAGVLIVCTGTQVVIVCTGTQVVIVCASGQALIVCTGTQVVTKN